MRIGVVGVGRIGQYHARVVQSHPDVSDIVLVDADRARTGQVAAELGAEIAETVPDLLQRVDAVIVASPTNTHASMVRLAVEASLPTFCEKPIALDLQSTIEVVKLVRASGATVQMGFQRRFDAGYRAARQAICDDALGRIYAIRIAGHDPAPPHESYLPGSGGIFRDLHIHDFDIIRWVLGQEVVEVYVQGSVLVDPMFARHDDVDTVAATLTFSDGTLGVLTGGRHDPLGYDIRMELFGSKDVVSVGWDARMPMRSLEPGMPPAAEHPYAFFLDRFDAAYRAELTWFVDVAQGRAENPCSVEDAEAALRIALACDQSRREHRPVRVDEVVA